ncbi:MerR family transcriptional regulator [Burkholderia stagnalis]|uniref:MerR family transcriptional regulator n=1 Tax=Burkholderia stagnalis TaxID=1503054 RepID=UPI0009BD4C91|nr:MerR family transcriptional regulator [Burkholderia stagnalis]MDY7805527.1 MerR family transcriptional regulator [Burkholderia stagnalis]
MPLTVGMLARRCGITVRTLHYYDQTGLLKPSGRSTSGYRLYDEASVSTIRTIQALRGLGLTLDAIARMLCKRQVATAEVIAESRLAIDAELTRLNNLNARLEVLQAASDSGVTWLDADWPETLAWLERYRAHFDTAEIAKILARWKDMEAALSALFADMRDAMDRHVPPDSGEAQKLAYRWLAAAMQWMNGDIAVTRRWRQLHEGAAPAHTGLDPALIAYIEQATRLHVAAWRRHLTEDDIQRLDKTLSAQWIALGADVRRAIAGGAGNGDSSALVSRWHALLEQTTRGDVALRGKLLRALLHEPILQAGHPIGPDVLAWLQRQEAAIAYDGNVESDA